MERDIIKAILKVYHARGAYAVKIHGEYYQTITVDILACYRGHFIGLEVKDGYKRQVTPMQRHVLTEINLAGGISRVAHNVEEAVEILDEVDNG